ncbi:MAG: metallophosphoesterase [Thermoanaerobaculia bacterium]
MKKLRVSSFGAAAFLFSAAAFGLPAPDPVLVGAGDISTCSNDGDERTAKLLDKIDGTVFTLGDNVYPNGTASQFDRCYEPTWGRHKKRTRPVPGNHDYQTAGAAPYFAYFGDAAGDPKKGYYIYDLGTWHVVVLNSNCAEIGGCQKGSAQEKWLRGDLAAHPTLCTLAMWHHPRFSSGTEHGSSKATVDFWRALQDAGAAVVLSGHDHDYERFAPQDADGKADPERGIREFVVGTGGKSFYQFGQPVANSEIRNANTYGVLKLTLHPDGYDWRFVPVEGGAFEDSGSAKCHAGGSIPTAPPRP